MGILDSFCNLIPGIIALMILAQGVAQSLAQQETAGNSTGSAAKERYIPSREEFEQRHDQNRKDFEQTQNTVNTIGIIIIIVAIAIPVCIACVFVVICLRRKQRGAGMMNRQIMVPMQQYNSAYGNNTGDLSKYYGQQY